MAGTCVEKTQCPVCESNGETVQIFEEEDGAITGYCFRCFKPFDEGQTKDLLNGREPRKAKALPEEYIKQQIQEMLECPIVALKSRGLTLDTTKHFKVRTGLSEQDGKTPHTWHFPLTRNDGKELAGFQTRIIETKQTYNTRGVSGCDLMGWKQALKGGKTLYITEGPLDAMSVHQVLTENSLSRGYTPTFNVVSLPLGAGSAKKYISQHAKDISRLYKEVRIVFDQDEAGQKAEKDATLALQGIDAQVMVCKLPYKDANDALKAGDEEAILKACLFQAEQAPSSGLILDTTNPEYWEEASKPPEMGKPWPWKGLTDLTRGYREGEVWYFGAPPKFGKSDLLNELAVHFLKGSPTTYMCKIEEHPHNTLRRLAGKVAHHKFHDPRAGWDGKAMETAKQWLQGRILMQDRTTRTTWHDVKQSMRQAAYEHGAKEFFVDPMTPLAVGLDASKTNDLFEQIAFEFQELMAQVEGTGFVFTHLNPIKVGKSHSFGGRIQSDHFTGSRAMIRYGNGIIGLEGNKDDQQGGGVRATRLRQLVLLEEREFGLTGRISMDYDEQTGMYREISDDEYIRIKEGLDDDD